MPAVEDIRRLAAEAKTRIEEISPDEARRRVAAGAVLIDVREEKEFQAGAIAGALHISRGALAQRAAAALPDSAAAVVCYCAIGQRSAIAADLLQSLGYRNVASMAGGLKAYLAYDGERKSA